MLEFQMVVELVDLMVAVLLYCIALYCIVLCCVVLLCWISDLI